MTGLEKKLFDEMARTIHLLGGQEDVMNILNMMNTQLSEGEKVEETLRLLECWNNNVENKVDEVPVNELYAHIDGYPCD